MSADAPPGCYPARSGTRITIVVDGNSKKEVRKTCFVDLFGNSGNSLFNKYQADAF